MILYVEELRATPLEQTFTKTRTGLVQRVRLHLCKYLSPAGTFTLEVLDEDDNVLAQKSLTLAGMIAAGGTDLQANYYHGHVTFEFNRAITLRPGIYKLKFSATGYTYADGEFIGWVKATDDPAIPITGDEAPDDLATFPYDYEILSLERIR